MTVISQDVNSHKSTMMGEEFAVVEGITMIGETALVAAMINPIDRVQTIVGEVLLQNLKDRISMMTGVGVAVEVQMDGMITTNQLLAANRGARDVEVEDEEEEAAVVAVAGEEETVAAMTEDVGVAAGKEIDSQVKVQRRRRRQLN